MNAKRSGLDSATSSLGRILADVPGMHVATGVDCIVVRTSEDSVADDRAKLRRLAAEPWEGWPIYIERTHSVRAKVET